jgi:Arc/MetJ-type ribon-helix-helix transcriptional regulator
MQIDLTPEQQDFVRQAVESGRFGRPEDAVQAAMTLWVDRERRRAEILAAVDIARASIRSGESIEVTKESMRALAEDVTANAVAQFVSLRESGREISPTSS